MNATNEKTENANALMADRAESTDPAYLAWRDKKVATALADARAHPERRVPQSEVWKKFGLET